MEPEELLPLVKANLGISTTVRDEYLLNVIKGCFTELEGKGISANEGEDNDYMMLVVDYASWQYRSRGESAMPRNIQYRIRNRIVKAMVKKDE